MKVKFWGTRGSIAAPGPKTVKYGGNTTCIEVRGPEGELVILDAGTGIRELGMELARNMPLECYLLVTHTHWDHINGLPFFVPLFVPGNRIVIYGPPDPITMSGVERVLSSQMAYPHFPVRVAELKSDIVYETVKEGGELEIGSLKISATVMNHPALTFGFKIECRRKSFFFTGDHEPFFNIYASGDRDFEAYEEIVQERKKGLIDFISGVDVLIADSQYTPEEYPSKVGWGHSTHEDSLALARAANVKSLYMTHHEITRTDDELDAIIEQIRNDNQNLGFEVHMAAEGVEFEV